MSKTLLITGGAGFSGSHLCEHVLHNTDWNVIVLDRLSYAGSLERLRDTRQDFPERIRFVYHDFRAQYPMGILRELVEVDYIIHAGAETHVENSIHDPLPFVESNVMGTMWTLEAARQLQVKHFIYVSTDEVHGPAPEGCDFREDDRLRPSNPYSASKAGGEALAYAWWNCYRLPVTITRTMNIIGERQHGEKFVPMCIRKLIQAEPLIIHGDSSGHIASRKWLHARNQASALLFLLQNVVGGGEFFNIAGEEHSALEVAQIIADELATDLAYELVDYHQARPGHDMRYSLDDTRIRALGWFPPVPFEESLRRTVRWSILKENRKWLEVDFRPSAHLAHAGGAS